MKTLAILTALVLGATTVIASAQTPGTVPAGSAGAPAPQRPAYLPESTTGLKAFYRVFGRYQLSVDAAGKAATTKSTIYVDKPGANATVVKAFLMSATFGGARLTDASVELNGRSVSYFATEFNLGGFMQNGLADVTDLIKAKVDAAPVGRIAIQIKEKAFENADTGIDGETLAVVFKTPSDDKQRTLVLLFGAQQVGGDTYEIILDKPIDPASPSARAEMGLGISFSYQLDGVQQFSTVDVNGRRLTSSAGGQDDGSPADTVSNGGLITAGGVGDLQSNPNKPFKGPTKPKSDDERYSLLPFINKTDQIIRVTTVNPSNDDNIFFAWFDLSSQAAVDGDEDGDGLKDSWETKGYDHDGDGVIDVDLPALGADPKRRDLFIAYAWMVKSAKESVSHQPTAAVLDAVSAAFDRAPVPNPSGLNGVKVHWKSTGSVAHDDDLNPVWDEFDALMGAKLTAAQRKIYRRMLNAHGYGGTSSSGLARGIPASDFIESLGLFSSNPGTFTQRAGTIMHELGHTLGLRHGGVDHENYKPNHLSVMSYLNQLEWLVKDGKPFLDYERFNLGDLNETALNERAGLDAAARDAALSGYGVRFVRGGFIKLKPSAAGTDVDWNGNASIEESVALDVNNTTTLSTLRGGFVEWSNLIFAAGDVGAGGDPRASFLANPQTDLKELSEEEFLKMTRKTR